MPDFTLPWFGAARCSQVPVEDQRGFLNLPELFTKFEEHNTNLVLKNHWMFKNVQYNEAGGDDQALVVNEGVPLTGQLAYPDATSFCDLPTDFVTAGGQRKINIKLFRRQFRSPEFCWSNRWNKWEKEILPTYTKHVNARHDNFMAMFERAQLINFAPTTYFMGGVPTIAGLSGWTNGLMRNSPHGLALTADTAPKSLAFLGLGASTIGDTSLSYDNLEYALDAMQEISGDPWSGSAEDTSGKVNDAPAEGSYMLFVDGNDMQNLMYDPRISSERKENEDIQRKTWKGPLFSGRMSWTNWHKAPRFNLDNNGAAVFPDIQKRMDGNTFQNLRNWEVYQNEQYTNASYGLAILMGRQPLLRVTPPKVPDEFRRLQALDWNGRLDIETNFITMCNGQPEINQEKLRLRKVRAYGIAPRRVSNIMLLVYKRGRNGSRVLNCWR